MRHTRTDNFSVCVCVCVICFNVSSLSCTCDVTDEVCQSILVQSVNEVSIESDSSLIRSGLLSSHHSDAHST